MGLSPTVIASAINRLPGTLTDLSLHWTEIDDMCLILIASNHSKSLKNLNIMGCSAVTDTACISVVQKCPHLSHLNVYRCRGITPSGEDAIIKQRPTLNLRGTSL